MTGSLLVFWPEIEAAWYPELFHVPRSPAQVTLQSIMDTISSQNPGTEISLVSLPADAESSVLIRLRSPTLRRSFRIFADPYTGRILGALDRERFPVHWLFHLHANLALGQVGHKINGVVALLCCVLSLTGLIIWWPGLVRWRDGLRLSIRGNWKRAIRDLHATIGFWSMAGLLVLALSGAYYPFRRQVVVAANWMTGSSPVPRSPHAVPPEGLSRPPTLDQLIWNAGAALPGGRVTRVALPRRPRQPVSVLTKLPGEIGLHGDSRVYLNQHTGEVLRVDRHAESPLGSRILAWIAPIHFGSFGGVWSRILWVGVGLAPALLFPTGFLIWWNRVLARRR